LTDVDVAIVGGGPTGLATAIESARRGLSTVVFERHAYPVDKACGEGVLPTGVEALEALGVRQRLPVDEVKVLAGLRYVQEDGSSVEGRFPSESLAVRRTALSSALLDRARACGVRVMERAVVREHHIGSDGVKVETNSESFLAQVLVAADGLSSPIRRAAGLGVEVRAARRYGLRQHFSVAPWTDFVEVHLAPFAEAYVTPSGKGRVGLAFLFEKGGVAPPVTVEALLQQFPLLSRRLKGAAPASHALGAGPFLQRAARVTGFRLACVGDAAGYVDAITGEGLALGLQSARSLGAVLPTAVEAKGSPSSLAPYEQRFGQLFRSYAVPAHALLWLAKRPALRRAVVRGLHHVPWVFERLVALALLPGAPGPDKPMPLSQSCRPGC
jgi:flavin-dependent dehydrogenase